MPILQVGFAVFSVTRLVKTRVHGTLKLAFGLEISVLSECCSTLSQFLKLFFYGIHLVKLYEI